MLCESATFVFWSPIYFFLNIYKLFFFRSFAGCCVWLWASLSFARRKKKIEIDKQDQRLQENNIIIYLLFRTKRLLQTMSSCFLIMALTTVSVNYTKFPFGCAFRSERDIFFSLLLFRKTCLPFFHKGMKSHFNLCVCHVLTTRLFVSRKFYWCKYCPPKRINQIKDRKRTRIKQTHESNRAQGRWNCRAEKSCKPRNRYPFHFIHTYRISQFLY